jgi:DNA-binding NarL/FixJ family response regulator
MTSIRLLLLGAEPQVRNGLAHLLAVEPDLVVVGEAGTSAEAMRLAVVTQPDVAVIDGDLPDASATAVCRRLREQHPGMGRLVLTSYDDDEALLDAVLAGASGYALRQVRGAGLVAALRAVAGGGKLLDESTTERVLRRIRDVHDSRLAVLDAYERGVLLLVAQGRSDAQIGAALAMSSVRAEREVARVLAKISRCSWAPRPSSGCRGGATPSAMPA